jgi:ferrous-iron efflux pump FieF
MNFPVLTPTRIAYLSLAISAVVLAFLLTSWFTTGSLLALSQAADSVSDLLTGSVMIWAASIGAAPADENHPHGHQAAEPIAALLVAMLAGMLAIEVIRSSIEALVLGAEPLLTGLLLGSLALKTVLKAIVLFAAGRARRTLRSPVLDALAVDARNDVTIGIAAVLGFLAARYGWPWLDAAFALPAGLWVAWGGLSLARENIALLMGEAAPSERSDELAAVVDAVPGVDHHHALLVRHFGAELEVSVHIVLDENLSLREAHDIGEEVERALLASEDVCRATVHLDVEDDRPSEAPAPDETARRDLPA